MTASEWSFMVLGLALGVVSGAVLVEILRARPPAQRQVRLTVAHEAIPARRAMTLAGDAFTILRPEPARGGPADRRFAGGSPPTGTMDRRTSVRSVTTEATDAGREMVGFTITASRDPAFDALRSSTIAQAVEHAPVAASTAVALLDPPSAGGSTPAPASVERCAEERRLSVERCELATRARAQADATTEALRVAQRRYDEHEAAAVTASWRADPRAVHQAKDEAQGGFRAAVAAATTPDALEAAARDWLNEINRINTDAREATTAAAREHAAAALIGADLDRLSLEADAGRIRAETAETACLSARIAVADCEEATIAQRNEDRPPVPITPELPRLDEDETLTVALEVGGAPVIFRLLRGDRQAMTSLVAALAGDAPDDRRHWQLLMTGLVEAIVADAIQAAALEFPDDHPFWGLFTREQNRDIAHALASLGYRFDGLGGWIDERTPSQRDLSLALGYAGQDPMRIRQWPDADGTAALFSEVTVAADEYLAGVAGDLTLAEMVTMLGRRADSLAEVWNTWGQIRPLLLDET